MKQANQSATIQVGMSALFVAYSAIVADVDRASVDAMVAQADELLGSGDPLARACFEFATAYEMAWSDPQELEKIGRRLQHAVECASVRVPPGLERSDIYG